MSLEELSRRIQRIVLLEYEGVDLRSTLDYVTDRIVSLIETHIKSQTSDVTEEST